MVQIGLIPVLLVIGNLGVLHLTLYFIYLYKKKNKLVVLDVSDVLRGPGQSLLKQIDYVNEDLKNCFVLVFSIPILILVTYVIYSNIGNGSIPLVEILIFLAGGCIFFGYYLVKTICLRSKRRYLKISYNGEVMVANELSQMTSLGYQVYHDFPGDGFNIDHILIGPHGVMAVETITLSKNIYRNKKSKNAVVTYDGRMLHFPKFSDHKIIDQAKRQAEWFSQWLSTTIGIEISARAMVALPGWHVKRTSPDGIPVVNPKQFETLFKHIKPRPLTESVIGRIVRQVEQQCSEADPKDNSCYSFSQ